MTAATNKLATSQRISKSSTAARRPTAAMSHTHIKEATNPIVNARSTTCGTHSSETASHSNNTLLTTRSVKVQRVFTTGNSTTTNSAQAASIQLTNKGMTAVDGLLANGLSHGMATHSTKMTFRGRVSDWNDEFMRRFSITPACSKVKAH
jgi:hypothetical protein